MKLSILVPATTALLLMAGCNKPEANQPASDVCAPQPERPNETSGSGSGDDVEKVEPGLPSSEEPVAPPPEEEPPPDSEGMAPAAAETSPPLPGESASPAPADTFEAPGEVPPDGQAPPQDSSRQEPAPK